MDTNLKQINGVDVPSPVAAADAGSNATVAPIVLARLLGFNGATWDRLATASDAADSLAALTTGLLATISRLQGWDGSNWQRIRAIQPGDAQAAPFVELGVLASMRAFNGATYDRLRVPNIFKSFASTAITAGTGATIWTPAGGKKFRLMGFMVSTSVAGQVIFGDNLAATVIMRSAAAAAAGIVTDTGSFGNGVLSAAANNVLKIDGPTGNVAGMVWGCEE